jgi:ferredoxin--NADP+ reductase
MRDAELEIPGVDLPGSFGASDFVSWYDGHPDVPRDWPLDDRTVAVIGNGNVALDAARMLVKHAEDLLPTEVPKNVYDRLANSPITDVHLFGRRGPTQVKFTPLELRELGELDDVDMIVYDEDFDYDEASRNAIASNKQVFVIDKVLNQWRERTVGAASRRLHLHFYAKPLEVVAGPDGRVASLRYERTEPDGAGGIRGTGENREVEVQAVYRAVGYFGSPLPGVPFDAQRGVIPNHEGQVYVEGDTEILPGVYATGWIKRGPVGLIGHTKGDALETVTYLLEDRENLPPAAAPAPETIVELLENRGVQYTSWEGWLALDAHERSLGERASAAADGIQRERIKVVPREAMVQISRDGVAAEV